MSAFYFVFFLVVGYLIFSSYKRKETMQEVSVEEETTHNTLEEQSAVEQEPKLENLSKEELFALSLANLEYERLGDLALLEHLKNEWGLSFEDEKAKEHTLYTLQQIWSTGTLSLVFRNVQLEKEVSIADMVAFDSVRFSELLRQVLYLKFLDEEEVWGLLFLNAQRVQDSFKNWAEFRDAYFRGLTLYDYSKLEEEAQGTFEFKKEFLRHKERSNVELEWLDEEIFSHFKIKL